MLSTSLGSIGEPNIEVMDTPGIQSKRTELKKFLLVPIIWLGVMKFLQLDMTFLRCYLRNDSLRRKIKINFGSSPI